MRKLTQEQKSRLVCVLNERLNDNTVRGIASLVGCSFGYISEIANGKRRYITENNALFICRGLGINPYYVLKGSEPKYYKWEDAFS